MMAGSAVIAAALVVVGTFGGTAAAKAPHVIPHVTDAAVNGPTVVAIGDSIVKGRGLTPAEAWPAQVARADGWRLTNLATSGAGFVKKGAGGVTFADEAAAAIPLKPSVIVIQASRNDLGEPADKVSRAITTIIDSLHASLPRTRLIAVRPVWSKTEVPGELTSFRERVAAAVTAAGGHSVDIGTPLVGGADLMQSDGIHPTVAGQTAIADAVRSALAARSLP